MQIISPDWLQYERLKAEWKRANPTATPAEYDAAIKRIADKCGV